MNTSDVLNKAADLIEERGWTRGPAGMYPDVRELCLEGAIRVATDGQTTRDGRIFHYLMSAPCPAGQAVMDYLGTGLVWQWNDASSRTATEVIEVLRACAVIEAAKESAETRQVVSA